MLKKIVAAAWIFLLLSPGAFAAIPGFISSNTDDSTGKSHFKLMPASHLVPLFTADSRAHRLSITNVIGTGEFIGSMGGIFPVARFNKFNKTFQLSAASTLYTTLVRKFIGGALINTDFFVDIFLDMKVNDRLYLRSSTGHTSQHLSDDAAHKYSDINYVRDYIQLFGIYHFPKQKAFVYGGIIFNHNLKTTNDTQAFDLSGRPSFQLGLEHTPFHISRTGYAYWAADIKFKGEVDFGTTENIQLGVKWISEDKRAIRIALNYGFGYDERGQFYTQKREYVYCGVYLDF